MKNSDIKIYTSFVSPVTWNKLVKEKNLLPILAIRNIKNSNIIGYLDNTAVHMKELAPSHELFRAKRDKEIDLLSFKKQYLVELSKISISGIVDKFIQLFNVSGADGIVIFGYGSDYESCHRSIFSDMMNTTEYFKNKIKEYKL